MVHGIFQYPRNKITMIFAPRENCHLLSFFLSSFRFLVSIITYRINPEATSACVCEAETTHVYRLLVPHVVPKAHLHDSTQPFHHYLIQIGCVACNRVQSKACYSPSGPITQHPAASLYKHLPLDNSSTPIGEDRALSQNSSSIMD